MARVSRKYAAESAEIKPLQRIYNTAVYVRLSHLDSDKNNSNTIEMQKYMVEEFVNTQEDMLLKNTYCDNGFTGTNFARPDFERMMIDVRSRKIDCIVVKDLSRFGRDYIETEYFLQSIFPFLKVRFVSLSDNYDSIKNKTGDDMVVSLKNIVNNLYSKDISKKVSSALHQKQVNGDYIGGIPPYGYKKDECNKNKLVIDEETAPIVREIFQMRLQGLGYVRIARELNERNILNPCTYNYLKAIYKVKEPTAGKKIWLDATIKTILNNQIYTGDMVQRKSIRSLSNGIPVRLTDESEQIIVPNTHEAIIEKKLFFAIQDINKSAKNKWHTSNGTRPTIINIFKGLVFCSDCGRSMLRNKKFFKNCEKPAYIYSCRTRRNTGKSSSCTFKSLKEEVLINIVSSELKKKIMLANAHENKIKVIKSSEKYKELIKIINQDIKTVENDISKAKDFKLSLFESYSSKLINLSEFEMMKGKYNEKIDKLTVELSKLVRKKKKFDIDFSKDNKWLQNFTDPNNETMLTQELVAKLIKRIEISDYNTVNIVWNFKEDLTIIEDVFSGRDL